MVVSPAACLPACLPQMEEGAHAENDDATRDDQEPEDGDGGWYSHAMEISSWYKQQPCFQHADNAGSWQSRITMTCLTALRMCMELPQLLQ